MMQTDKPNGDGVLNLFRLWRRFLAASSVLAVLLICDLLFRSEIPLFSPRSSYEMPDWLGALLLIMVWLVPVTWVLGISGIRRATLAQLALSSLIVFTLTALSILVIAILVFVAASIYFRAFVIE